MSNMTGLNKMQQIGLALSNFADAANMFSGRPTGYANANLQGLQALQRQLLLNRQIAKQDAQDSAVADIAGGFDPKTGITWNSGQMDPGLATSKQVMTDPGIAAQAPSADQPVGIAAKPAAFESQPVSDAERIALHNDFSGGQLEKLKAAFPEEYAKSSLATAMAPPTPVSTPEGGRTDFVKGGQVVSSIIGAPKTPEKVKEVEALFGPDWRTNPRAVDYYNKITMPMSVSLSANTQGENQFSKTLNEQWGKEAAEVSAAANQARDRITSVQQFMALADQVKTGKLTPTQQEVSAWAEAVGVDPKNLGIDPKTATAAQVMDKIQNRLAMQNIGPGGLPANNFSEADRKFVQATTVNKANTPEANRLIAQIGIAADRRQLLKDKMWTDAYRRGTNWPTFKQQWSEYVDSTPMFPVMKTPEEAGQLPSGSLFTTPDGQIKVRP